MKTISSDELDAQDMARLATGGDVALDALMNRHAERLFQYLIRSLQSEEDAADLAQETFVRVYQHRGKFDRNQKFTTWLYAIASNLVRDRYRWRSRHPQVSLEQTTQESESGFGEKLPTLEHSPDEQLQAQENSLAVQKAISELPVELREPLILSVYQDLQHSEIGQILNCTAKAVETRIYRARQQLRSKLSALVE